MTAPSSRDPREIIEQAPMSAFQWRVVAVMIGLTALDGFDVLSISFASPGIAKSWGIDRATLGFVLSMELIGMAVGALVLGPVADRVGRRATILGCLVLMATGMFGAAAATGVGGLSIWRVLTGLGIGGMLAATNAAVAEVASAKHRNLCVVLMAGGYPVGTVIGGSIATALLGHYDWPAVFVFGGIVTLFFIPIVLLSAPESIAFLVERRPAGALARINATLAKMNHAPVEVLPDSAQSARPLPLSALFDRGRLVVTVALTAAYLAHIMTFYFILKWIPKIVADMGYTASMAGSVLVWASVGGASGSLIFGLLTARLKLLTLTIVTMIASTVFVTLFGQGSRDLTTLSVVATLAGFVTNAGVVGLYALIAQSYPTALRASATGFIIGVGRGGSALAPALAGILFAAGQGLPAVSFLMGLGSLLAAAALAGLRLSRSDPRIAPLESLRG